MSDANRSKYLSLLLRHKPENANLTLDKEGWCSVQQLIDNAKFSFDELTTIVAEDQKGRYSFNADKTKIRANQGHSTGEVNMTFKKAVPPTVLYHGTSLPAWKVIEKTGLKPMSRHHVHLSALLNTAKDVGGRRKGPVIVIDVDAKQMLADGYNFYISENGVWLTDEIPPKYLKEHK